MGPQPNPNQLERAAEMFRAVGDFQRLRLLIQLAEGEFNVTRLCEIEGEKITTMSARLKVLSAARLVRGGGWDRRSFTR